ncbi:MAG: DUF554 domain-containing protein [Deltaproteobacteria bacterium]|nr:DUF554 domain-containing protein [Deltaproteobacteria bacterium]MBW1748576.1 DUF554 domain-containing protein [Deltaproteobacteria bacterium]MBW1826811.1 DUF554 domain-containing protein [Deltaproteobacteria bacterium]MBW1969610.1 DUF554 domain-containing protein [Deltaproteobacteria bacterium]MBW2155615.1 DUF554 domain-containing protein [Deltaproteobacteria bacterium]
MLGTIVNTVAIIAGSLLGLLFRGGIPKKFTVTMMQAISLAVMLIGFKMALKSDAILLIIFSLVIGSLIGEFINIESRLERLGKRLETRFSKPGSGVAKGFVVASLVFCVGSMAIVGALESGLTGNHQTLFAKSALDGLFSIIFASSFGIGVLFSSASVFIYQGMITLTSSLMKPFLITAVINQMSAVGGILIMAIGINLLEIQKIKVGNMLPAIFIPLVYYMMKQLVNFF